jgi:hypothetical protein
MTKPFKRGDIVRLRKGAKVRDWSGTGWHHIIAIYTGEDAKDGFPFRFIGPRPKGWNHIEGFALSPEQYSMMRIITHATDD